MISESKPIEEMDKATKKLVRLARTARKKAYAPYSKFLVGCVIVDGKGKLHTGCNIENANYAGTICAERTAVAKMVSRGSRDIRKIVIVTSSDEAAFPCGECRQVLFEFGRAALVTTVNHRLSAYREAMMSELLAGAFSREQLRSR